MSASGEGPLTFDRLQSGILRTRLASLGTRLLELDNRIDEENDDALRALREAWHQYNGLAELIDPELVVQHDDADSEG